MGKKKATKKSNGNGANLVFEAKLWLAADKLRDNLDAAEYRHVVLGLVFLKCISDAFEEMHARLVAEEDQGADLEDPDEHRAENVFWVPPAARWASLQGKPSISLLLCKSKDELVVEYTLDGYTEPTAVAG